MGASVVKTFSKLTIGGKKSSDLIVGTVKTSKPLSVEYEGQVIPADCLVLSPFCIKTSVNLSHRHSCPDGTTSVELQLVELWRGLKPGDKVWMSSFNDSQKFYILQRKEGVMIE